MKPTDFGFSYESYRECQTDALAWLAQQPDKSIVMLEAPPGTGKTLVGATWAVALGGKHGFILTRTLSLLDQYESQAGLLGVRGAANFACHSGGTCEDGVVKGCAYSGYREGNCPYFAQRRAGDKAQVAVTSYAYALASSEAWSRCSYLVCDEGHALLDVLTDHQSITVPWSLDPPVAMENLPTWAAWKEKKILIPDAQLDPSGYRRATDIVRNLERLKTFDPYASLYIMGKTSRSLVLRPLWPTPSLFRGKKVLIMSATLYGGAFLADLFDFTDGNWAYHTVESPFAVARRPFYLMPCGSLTVGATDHDYRRMASGIRGVIERHPRQRGLIHLSSYKQVERLRRLLPKKLPILYHSGQTRENRAALFRQFRTTEPPVWLMSPSVREGEDFPYEAARVNVIAKISYPDLGDPVVAARRADGKRGKAYYAAVTCGNLAQAYGRAMRANDDWGLTYCLDASIFNLLKYNRQYLPQHLLEAMVRL